MYLIKNTIVEEGKYKRTEINYLTNLILFYIIR
jgi:hypothetical protein